MASRRVTDARLFWAEYAFLHWPSIYKPMLREEPIDVVLPALNPDLALKQVALRWHVNAAEHPGGSKEPIGLPTGPFTVWRRRPFDYEELEKPLDFHTNGGLFLGLRLVTFHRTVATVTLEVQSSSGGAVFGLGNAPKPLSVLTWLSVPAGTTTIQLAAGRISGLLIPPTMTINDARGSRPRDVAEELEWEEVEIVGMPVDGSWAGVGDHLTEQGLVGALTDPQDAAHQRVLRGTPPFGWHAHVEPGVAAPQWEPPDPVGVVDEVQGDLLPHLRDALTLPQPQQAAHFFTAEVPPPETLQGDAMSGSNTDAEVPTVALLQMAVGGDPFLSLAMGYGTNVDEIGEPSAVAVQNQQAAFDYMVTAPYREGLVGGEPIELATLALRPLRVFPPPIAAGIESELRANLAPVIPDADWRASTTTRWDRAPKMALARTASHAVTRHSPGDTAAEALLEKRPSQGHHPITPALSPDDDQKNFILYADRAISIPNNPGHRTLRYSVANQNLFGVWSVWKGAEVIASQPPLTAPRILAANFDVTAPATGTACPSTVTVDVTWDWADRRPGEIRLVGRMFAAANRAATAPIPFPPPWLERQIGVPGTALVLTFAGDVATLTGAPPGSELLYLDHQGDQEVAPGPAQGDGARRYRMHITGLTADFASTDHIGMALWASGRERIAPNRTASTTSAFYSYVSDPIAPAVPPELVPLSSLPDAAGSSHARISWPTVPGAAGYVVYGSDEITMRSHYGLGEPDLNDTLSDRVTELLDAWVASPDRRPFTRMVSRPVTGTSVDLALPRGTTGISTFVIVSMSAGQVEGPWPEAGSATLRDEVIVRATPRIATPATPELEARVDGTTVHLTVRTRPGHRAGRIEIHRVRVDEAVREIDTMGPPVASANEASPGWTVETDTDGTPLVYRGTDTPGPSWRRVWYRAVAWANEEWPVDGQPFPFKIAERGLLPGRSPSSNAVSVVVPPPDPPDLSLVDVTWPGGSLANVQLNWTTAAPFTAPLGAHRMEVDVRVSGTTTPLVSFSGELGAVGTAAPPTGDGLWRDDPSTPAAFHAVIRRPDTSTELDAIVRVIDPRGRASQQTVHVGAGAVLPPPNLENLEMFRIAGRGTVLTFTSSSPIVEIGGEVYTLRIAATPTASPPPFPPFPRPGLGTPPIPPIRPGPLRPLRPGERDAEPVMERPEADELIEPRPQPATLDRLRPRPLSLEIALPDIPVDRGQPPTADVLQIARVRGPGPVHSYVVLARRDIASFGLRLRSPDGRTATASKERP
jgi:hypothetical protein